MRTEFPNLAIVAITLKAFVAPWLDELEQYFETPQDKLYGVRNAASDAGNDEVVAMCDYIERQGLTESFFPPTNQGEQE